jgi:hypothetical protein
MDPAIKIIVENANVYPAFRYYIKLMKKAERNLATQPDICIEICKSLIEGVAKTIILDFEPAIDRKKLNNMDVSPLTKKACQYLRQDNTVIEDEFTRRVASTVEFMGVLRNERGDISHGRPVPKAPQSDDKLAGIIFQISSSLLTYMLDSFFVTKKLREAPASEELDDGTPSPGEDGKADLPQFDYEAFPDFNNSLDEKYPYEGKLAYSFALYQLYYEDYLMQLQNYQENLKGDEA